MFTGIIRELGVVRSLRQEAKLYSLGVEAKAIFGSVAVGDSVAVNGVCLTVVHKASGVVSFDVMAETARKTTLEGLKAGDRVNCESALRAGGTLDGHFVLGHIDCIGTIRRIARRSDEHTIEVGFPKEFSHLVVEKGSIAIDGISLTVGAVGLDLFRVYIIPHTLANTTLDSKSSGDEVNLEFDIIGKYVARLNTSKGESGISEDFLKAKGF